MVIARSVRRTCRRETPLPAMTALVGVQWSHFFRALRGITIKRITSSISSCVCSILLSTARMVASPNSSVRGSLVNQSLSSPPKPAKVPFDLGELLNAPIVERMLNPVGEVDSS